jgi:hypothetical protein
VSLTVVGDVDSLIDELLACCPMIRSLWLVADCAGGGVHAARLYTWDLIAFADPLSLQRLRRSVKLHRADVRVRVVGEDNRLESAWGSDGRHGVLRASEWQVSNTGEGTYTESSALPAGVIGAEKRVRRKAICVWQGSNALTGPGS